jgi:DNA modification methylase
MFRPASRPQPREGVYSGDQPNPNLRAFVEEHLRERPYDPASDRYAAPVFDQPIAATKATAIYNMHTYWSKKPHDAIRQYIRHYTAPGDLVLDPFCGSGGTALAALMEDRKAVAIDRSPAATFITKNYCTPVDPAELQEAFTALQAQVQPEIDWLYATRCDRCGGEATTAYTVYSQVFQCPRCLERVPLFDCVEVEGEGRKGKGKSGQAKLLNACPHCYARGVVEEISTRGVKLGAIPVLARYECLSGCKPARSERRHNDPDPSKRDYFQRFDLGKLHEIEAQEVPYWVPPHRMMNVDDDTQPWGAEWREGRNFRTVAELYTKRNLWALAAILDAIKCIPAYREELLFTFTSILLKSSRMMAHNNDGIGRIQKGTYYIPQIIHDIHVGQFYAEALGDMLAGYQAMGQFNPRLMISTTDARALDLPADSVDYIFTDPPYAEKVQYGELNFVWEAWLGFDTAWHDEEIIVNSVRGKTEDDWYAMMLQTMRECYRVLKPGRAISLCYHDTSEGTWALVQDLMAEAGFLIEHTDSALYIDTKTKTTNQYFADKVNKRDLVINFRKPRPGEAARALLISGDEDSATFGEKVRTIIRAYLADHPGSSKDRIYDEVVSRMVRAGRMEAHNFDELLEQVAEEGEREKGKGESGADLSPFAFRLSPSLWYLKETALAVEDAAESARETAAAKQVRGFVERKLAAEPAAQGIHYSDIFEHYVYSVKEKPRRALADWLLDYFYKTDAGTYRPPISEEEEQLKAQARAAGTNRRIRRYVAYLQQGFAVPQRERPGNADLAGWLRQCKRNGLYEYGRLLYERGGLDLDQLSEEQQVEVDEDYQTCMRMLTRAAASPPESKSRGRRTPIEQNQLDL